MALTIPQRVIAEKLVYVNYVEVVDKDDESRQHYYYIAVRAAHMDAFRLALKQEDFTPEDHGIILESGRGVPSESVRETMYLQYGCKHGINLELVEEDENALESEQANV